MFRVTHRGEEIGSADTIEDGAKSSWVSCRAGTTWMSSPAVHSRTVTSGWPGAI